MDGCNFRTPIDTEDGSHPKKDLCRFVLYVVRLNAGGFAPIARKIRDKTPRLFCVTLLTEMAE